MTSVLGAVATRDRGQNVALRYRLESDASHSVAI